MSKPMTENESLIWASGHFLTESFPKEFTDWSEEQINEFILSNTWQPFETWSAQDVWELIENLAGSVRELLSSPEPKKDDQKDTDFIQRQLDLGIE